MDLPSTPRAGQWRIGGYAPTGEEEHSDESTGTVKPESAAGDHSELVVEAFGETIGEFGVDVGEDAIFVFPDGSCCFHERFEFGAGGPGEPAVKLFFGVVTGSFFEDGGEGFLEQVGTIERSVVFLDSAELVPLFGAEVPWIFEQNESRLLDCGGLGRIVEFLEATHHLPAYFVNSFGS